jgi:hypothetical protein
MHKPACLPAYVAQPCARMAAAGVTAANQRVHCGRCASTTTSAESSRDIQRSDPTPSDSLHIPLSSDSSCHASESYIAATNAGRPFNSSAMFTPYTAQDRTAVEEAQKNTLAIVLTEPVVFLRPRSVQGHASGAADPGPSSMLRGLLSLTLRKPTRITSISVELTCTTRSAITEGVLLSAKWVFRLADPYTGLGARRIDTAPEEHTVYRAVATFFDSSCCPGVPRRSLSAGPAMRGLDQTPSSRIASERDNHVQRRFSTDHTIHQRDPISFQRDSSAWPVPPTPPYSPIERNDELPIFASESPPSSTPLPLARASSSTSVSSPDTGTERRQRMDSALSTMLESIKLSPRHTTTTSSSKVAKEFKPGL